MTFAEFTQQGFPDLTASGQLPLKQHVDERKKAKSALSLYSKVHDGSVA